MSAIVAAAQGSAATFMRWLRGSTAVERRLTAAGALLSAALCAWALLPIDTGAEGRTTAVSANGGLAGSGTGSAVDDATPDPDGPKTAVTLATGPTQGASAVGPPTAGDVPAQPTPTGAGPPRTASDRGVTADGIKLGFTIFEVAGVMNAGVGLPNIRRDIPEVIDVLVEAANASGGIHGRRIVAVKKYVDVVSTNDQRAKCLEFTRDDKVFAVIDSFAFLFRPGRACIADENETPLLTSLAGSRAEVRAHAPFQVSAVGDDNTIARNLVLGAAAEGFFDGANGFRKLGIFSDNCDRSVVDDASIGVKAYLRQIGITEWSEFVADCEIASLQRGGPPAVLQHRGDGVTHVLHVTYGTAIAGYLRAASAQGYQPEYFVSDYLGLTSDGIVVDFDPDQWDGVRGVTSTHNGEPAIGKPVNQNARRCSDILVAGGLPPIDDYSEDFEALYLCESLTLFRAAAARAPVNLTRADWGAAVPTLGPFASAWIETARFEPRLYTGGGRTIALVTWSRACRCYRQTRGFQPAP